MRVCANRYCPHRFMPRRKHHRFCTPECRKQDWIRRNALRGGKAGRTRSSGHRRASKDGKGTRFYVTARELDYLLGLTTGERDTASHPPGRIIRKLVSASERLQRKESR